MNGAAKIAKLHVIKMVKHKYEIRYVHIAGVSIIAFLGESHMAFIHGQLRKAKNRFVELRKHQRL